jgi:hypothetical protein
MSYSEFIVWLTTPNLAEWSESFRWSGWESEVATLDGDRAVLFTPFLGTAGGTLEERHRGEVPVEEMYSLFIDSDAPT